MSNRRMKRNRLSNPIHMANLAKLRSTRLLFALAWLFPLLIFAQPKGKQPTNIVFILSDDHSAPFVSSYGYPSIKTPNIDRLAQEGIRYTRAYTTAPQCVLSRAAL